eukprot:11887991-Karenia_brevis.AAC.1
MERVAQCQRRVPRFRRLLTKGTWRRRKCISIMAKTALHGSMLYGVKVTGVSDTMLNRMRRLTGRAVCGKLQGKSLTMSLLASGQPELDPIFKATYEP